MPSPPATELAWLSPLSASVALFLLYAALNIMVGVLAPLLTPRTGEPPARILFFSARSDRVVFDAPPAQILRESGTLALLRWLLLCWLSAGWMAFGLLQAAVAWFGLREGQAWALWALVLSNLASLPYWAAMIRVYVRRGAPLGLGDLPPLFTCLALVPLAALLGWLGLGGRGG